MSDEAKIRGDKPCGCEYNRYCHECAGDIRLTEAKELTMTKSYFEKQYQNEIEINRLLKSGGILP